MSNQATKQASNQGTKQPSNHAYAVTINFKKSTSRPQIVILSLLLIYFVSFLGSTILLDKNCTFYVSAL